MFLYDVTVSIVTYRNDKKELMMAVYSVLNSENVNLKLFIVDNSPTDELKHLFEKDNRIEYIFNNANLGFGKGHNIAIKKAIELAPYHLALNPDIYFDKNVLRKIIDFMELHPDIGQLLPQIINPDGSKRYIRRLLPTPFDAIFKVALPFLNYTKIREQRYRTMFASYDISIPAPFLSGCFIFLRNSIIKEVGAFDERFFMYFEDIDLSRRIYTYNNNIYYSEIQAVHIAHREARKSLKMLLIHMKSAVKYFNKWGWCDKERNNINRLYIEKYSDKNNV